MANPTPLTQMSITAIPSLEVSELTKQLAQTKKVNTELIIGIVVVLVIVTVVIIYNYQITKADNSCSYC